MMERRLANERSKQRMAQTNQRTTTMDNFVVQSRAFLQNLNIDKFANNQAQQKNRQQVQIKSRINGVNYFDNEIAFDKQVQVLADCVAVRGDNFYLKKGNVVRINSVICEYAYIKYGRFKGYFPCSFFNIDYRYKP